MICEKITQREYALIEAECSDMDSDNDVDSTSQDSTFDFTVSSHPENIEYESSSKEDDRSENTYESFDTEKDSYYSVEDDYRG